MSNEDHQSSFYRVIQWILVVAFLYFILTSIPYTLISLAGAELILGVFMLIDLSVTKCDRYQGRLAFSYFTCALAFGVAFSFLLVLCFPPEWTSQPSKEPMSLIEVLVYLFSGGFAHDIAEALSELLSLIIAHLFYFLVFTLLSFGTAIAGWKKHSSAKWLVLFNSPGMALILYTILMITFG